MFAFAADSMVCITYDECCYNVSLQKASVFVHDLVQAHAQGQMLPIKFSGNGYKPLHRDIMSGCLLVNKRLS